MNDPFDPYPEDAFDPGSDDPFDHLPQHPNLPQHNTPPVNRDFIEAVNMAAAINAAIVVLLFITASLSAIWIGILKALALSGILIAIDLIIFIGYIIWIHKKQV